MKHFSVDSNRESIHLPKSIPDEIATNNSTEDRVLLAAFVEVGNSYISFQVKCF